MNENDLKELPDVSFIDVKSINDVVDEMISDYEKKYNELTNSNYNLKKSDPTRAIIYACAMQIYQAFQFIERAGRQGLLKYSYGPFLDNLGALKGVVRNTATKSKAIVRFITSELHKNIIIPLGTRVAAEDIYFETILDAEIQDNENYIDIEVQSINAGSNSNNCKENTINVLVDSIPYISEIYNITESFGGTDEENDETFSKRIFLSPQSYSVAGSEEAYKYYVMSANPDIGDVKIVSPSAGVVDIKLIMKDGNIPSSTIINDVYNALNNNRPLTDCVKISSPEIDNYNINLTYYISKSNSQRIDSIKIAVEKSIDNYISWQKEKIGRDINPSYLIKLIIEAGAKRVDILEPKFTKNSNFVMFCNSKNIVFGGLEDD